MTKVNIMPGLTRKIWKAAVSASNVHHARDPALQLGSTLAALYDLEAGSPEEKDFDALLKQIDCVEHESRRNGG